MTPGAWIPLSILAGIPLAAIYAFAGVWSGIAAHTALTAGIIFIINGWLK